MFMDCLVANTGIKASLNKHSEQFYYLQKLCKINDSTEDPYLTKLIGTRVCSDDWKVWITEAYIELHSNLK